MKETDILKDVLDDRVTGQLTYNEHLIKVRNPEARQLFTQLRDDEMRAIVKLQQLIDRLEAKPGIVSRIFTTKQKY